MVDQWDELFSCYGEHAPINCSGNLFFRSRPIARQKNSLVALKWSLVAALILKKGRAKGLGVSEIENLLGIGDQTGRVMRYWIDGQRVPNSIERNRVFGIARKLVLSELTTLELSEFQLMPDRWAQELLESSGLCNTLGVPQVLLSIFYSNPAIAARNLLGAVTDPDKKRTRLLREVAEIDPQNTCRASIDQVQANYDSLKKKNADDHQKGKPSLSETEFDQYWFTRLSLAFEKVLACGTFREHSASDTE